MNLNTDFDLHIASLNVRGLHNKQKRLAIFQFLKDKSLDIICLQETFCTEDSKKRIGLDWNGDIIHCLSDSPHSRGVCVLFKKNLSFKIISSHSSNDGRKLLINFEICGELVTLANLYAPNNPDRQKDFFKRSQKWIKQYAESDHLIVTGDLNTNDNSLDRSSKNSSVSAKFYTDFKKYLNIHDVWRTFNPNRIEFTWLNPADISMGSRIDYILSTKYIEQVCVKSCDIYPAPTPDHLIVQCKIKFDLSERGKGYWKLNISVLDETEFTNGIKKLIHETVNDLKDDLNNRQLWDIVKIKIKEYSIKYCITRKKNTENEILKLECDIKSIENQIKDPTLGNELKQNLKSERQLKQEKVNNYYQYKARGYQIRSRAKWIADGEKNSRYFLRLEKKHQVYNKIDYLQSESGIKISCPSDILQETHNFYSNLYSSNSPDPELIKSYLSFLPESKTLNEQDKQKCEGVITLHECHNAVKKLKKNKSPGIDGLPSEFYLKFWDDISHLIVNSFNESFENGELSNTQKMSVISLIFKKDNRALLKNYRPISLSNYDYKILAFILAERLQSVISKIISEDQSGYIRKRYIGTNIRTVNDLIEYTEKFHIGGIIIFLDFQKAFDSVEWNFMFETLTQFNFGPDFRKWIQTLYTDPKAVIKNNGFLSEPVILKRGIRQGCPVSALLFLLTVEILAEKVRNHPEYKGITVSHKNRSKEYKINQFADDGNLFLHSPPYIQKALDIVNSFTEVSGLGLNMSKTEVMGLGIYRNINFNTYGLKRVEKPIRCLGMYVGHNKIECYTLNWEDKMEKFEKILDQWRTRDLTLFGRVQILKSLALSQFTFLFINDTVENDTINKINSLMFKFLWNKTERIKRRILINSVDKGGINMIDLESHISALKATWVERIIKSGDVTWSFIPKLYLNIFENFQGFPIIKMNWQAEKHFPIVTTLPPFYKDTLIAYQQSKPKTMENDVMNEMIWGNPKFSLRVKKHSETLFIPNWITKNIIFVKDLKIVNGKIDHIYIKSKVIHTAHFIFELHKVQNALSGYIRNINHNPVNEDLPLSSYNFSTSKEYYQRCIAKKVQNLTLDKWSNQLNIVIDENKLMTAFINKVMNIKEKKLSEFNFKVLHNILATKSLVSKWDSSITELCEICNLKDDILHLLYNCLIAKKIWQIVTKLDNKVISNETVILGHPTDSNLNFIVTFVSFNLYKYWLVKNEEKQQRNILEFLNFVKSETECKIEVYNLLHETETVNSLKLLHNFLTNEI